MLEFPLPLLTATHSYYTERLRAPPRARSFVVTACPPSTPCFQQITCGNDNMIIVSFATQISNDNMRFASDGGTVVTGGAPDHQRQNARSSVGEGVRRRTAKTLRPTHMRPPMAVPASADTVRWNLDSPLIRCELQIHFWKGKVFCELFAYLAD